MRTHLYKFILILVAIFSFGVNAAKASLIVYVDVTCKDNSSNHAPVGYNSNMYIHYYLPDGDKPSYYVPIDTNSQKRVVNGRDVYRVVLSQHANYGYSDNLQWRWYVCRKDPDQPYGHIHLDTLYHKSNYYVVKGWLYNKETKTGGVGYRTPGLVTGGHIYFDNSRTKWNGNLQFVIGHGSEMHTYNLVKVDNTELYYLDLATTTAANWGIDHSYYSFIANTTAWPAVKNVAPERVDQSDIGFSENYRRQGELLTGNYYVFRPQNDNQKLFDIITNRIPVYAIYQRVKIRPTDGAYQSMNDNAYQWPATISIKSTISLDNYTTPVFTTESGTKNYNAEAMIAGEVVHTYTNLNSAAYKFEGWGTGEAPVMSESYTHYLARNTYVYAFFTAKSFKVTLNNQNATDPGPESVNPSYGYAMPTITPPTRTGYTFGGYYTETNGGGTQYYKADGTSAKNYDRTSTLTLYAKWTANTYIVTLDNQGATSAGTTSVTATYDETMPPIIPPTRTGYTFGGYYTEPNGGGTQYYNQNGTAYDNKKWDITSPTTLHAQWNLIIHTVTWLRGEDTHATTSVSVETPLSLPTSPANDALGCCADAFIGWSVYAQPTKEQVFNDVANAPEIDENKTFYAVFATAAQGVGTSVADFSEMGYENGTAVTDPIVLGDGEGHGDATITLEKAQSSSNAPTYYTDGEAVRIYAGGTITIASSYHIKKVTFTFATGDGTNEITANPGTYVEGEWTENVESPTNNLILTIGGEAGQHRRIASITVTTGVSGSQYTNYVTQCTTLPNPALSDGSVPAIAVNCGDFSALSNSQAIVFSTMQDLTCPVTFEVIDGDFLISTARDRAAQYQSKVKVVPYKTGENPGKLRNVYVRANATDHNENFTGTLKVTSDEIAEDVIIDITANVTCEAFTLTTNNHLGTETVVVGNYFAGDVIDTEPTPSSDECTAGYTFDGWSTSAVEYGSLIYNKVSFPFTMPNHDVILYPVYRINTTEDYHRVTSDLGAENWAGDYLIAFSDQIFADGYFSGTNEGSLGDKMHIFNPNKTAENLVGDVVKADWGDNYYITLETVEGGYVLKSRDNNQYNGKIYNYYTNNTNESGQISVTDSPETAAKYAIQVVFVSQYDIRLSLSGNAEGAVFRYGSTGFRFYKDCGGHPIYLYKKSPLYTSYLACGTISVSEEEVYVTATEQRGIMANQPLTVTANNMYPNAQVIVTSNNADVYFSAERNVNFAMAAENQPQQSLTLTANETGALSQSIYIHYRPSSEGDGVPADVEVTAKSHNLPISDNHTIHVRNLPAKFVIATKVGAVWYALPANMTESTNPSGVVIEVDETNMTAIAPTTTTYTLWPVKTTNGTGDRYKEYGERLRFAAVNYGQRGLWANNNNSSSTIKNYAVINSLGADVLAAYEWKLTTTVVDGHWQYTLQTDQTQNQNYLRYCTSAEGGAKWGTYESGVNTLYLLPMTEITEMNVEVMEWGTNSMALRFEGDAPANVDITLGETTKNVTLTNLNSGSTSDIYKVEGVALTTNDGEVLKIVDNTSNNIKLLCKPILVTGESVSTAYSTLETTVCDVVVLNGGKLSAGDAHVDFANIYVYPGGKLILDGKSLGAKQQVYLRGGYSWLNSEYALPELYLNGTIDFNGSGNIIYDYYIQNYKYYQFALPYDVQLEKVTDEAGIDNFPVWVKHYNGALRALDPHATSWEWYPSENGDAKAYFKAGEGYIIAAQPRQVGNTANRPLSIIRFPLGNKVFSTAETNKSVTTKAHGIEGYKAGTVTANNVGWNFIGNPFMSTWKGDIGHQQLMKSPDAEHWNGSYHWENNGAKYITVMSPEDGTDYDQYTAANTELKPFFPFYIQETADGGNGTINFAAANRVKKAPALWNVEQDEREAYIQIEIAMDAVADQTGVFVSNKYSDEIDFDDYEKMFGSSTDKPKVWLMHEGKRMAFEAVTESKAAAYTAIGYRAPQTGKYMFAINEEASKLSDVEAVYLTDNLTGVTAFDLMSSIYEFESDNELYNDTRFTIHIVLRDESPGTTTGVGNLLHFNSEQPMKFIYQDKMYILQNGVIYDAMGKQVQTINK